MAAADVQQPPAEPTPGLPDYVTTPNATLGDKSARWRYGSAPDYSKTRKAWQQTKSMSHEALSLPQLVENLVKNWEVEASFKTDLDDWRTIDRDNYTFAINGGPPQSAEHMLKVGTYNAIIDRNDFYDSRNSDFASSHKTFKRMMPTFAWEVLEVYSGPPTVTFKWRHWGRMQNDYVGFNDKGEKVTAKAHGGNIDIVGITTATVNDALQLKAVDTYFDPMQMFKQIAPEGIVNKETVHYKVSPSDALRHSPDDKGHERQKAEPGKTWQDGFVDLEIGDNVTISRGDIPHIEDNNDMVSHEDVKPPGHRVARTDEKLHDGIDEHLSEPADKVFPQPQDAERDVKPTAGQAVAAAARSDGTKTSHEEMSRMTAAECPFLNRE